MFKLNERQRKLKGQQRIDNLEPLSTQGTQDTARRQTKQKTQPRDTGNIGYILRHRAKTNKTQKHNTEN